MVRAFDFIREKTEKFRQKIRFVSEYAQSDREHDKNSNGKRYGTVRYGTVRYGTLRYATLRYGTLRYATVRYATDKFGLPSVFIFSQLIKVAFFGSPLRILLYFSFHI